MTAEEGSKLPLSTSQYYMWRMLLSIAWADGNCGDEETAYFAKLFDNLDRYYDLTQDQRDGLAKGLEAAEDPWPLFSYINDPEPRRMLVLYAEALVMLDGVLDPREDAILQRLRVIDPPGYDVEQLRLEVRKIVADGAALREKEKEEIRAEVAARSPHVAVLDRLLRKAGIDILFD